jgi:periplasmic mercuric ion binding protein
MKTIIKIFPLIALLSVVSPALFAQSRNAEVEIKTSAQCPMCKERIEKTLTFERGVRHALLDLETKKVTVRYNARRTGPDKLREAITSVGYDADKMEADPKAYASLPGCCKKPDDPDYVPHSHP